RQIPGVGRWCLASEAPGGPPAPAPAPAPRRNGAQTPRPARPPPRVPGRLGGYWVDRLRDLAKLDKKKELGDSPKDEGFWRRSGRRVSDVERGVGAAWQGLILGSLCVSFPEPPITLKVETCLRTSTVRNPPCARSPA